MIAKYIPDAADLFYEGHAGNQGDAVAWGEALGASIRDMGRSRATARSARRTACISAGRPFTEGGFQVNKHGRRFSNENAGYSEQALNVQRQPDHVAWAIWDERCERIAVQQHSHVLANETGAIKRFDSVDANGARDRLRRADARADGRRGRGGCTRGERRTRSGATSPRSPRCSLLTAWRRSWARSRTRRAGSK
jgi:fumarate reductase flavoprotein subunit